MNERLSSIFWIPTAIESAPNDCRNISRPNDYVIVGRLNVRKVQPIVAGK